MPVINLLAQYVHGKKKKSTFQTCFTGSELHSRHSLLRHRVLLKFTKRSRLNLQQQAALKCIILAVKVFVGIINCA